MRFNVLATLFRPHRFRRSMRVLIAGCGYVGSALAGRLVAEGEEVWGLRREPAGLPKGVRPVRADLTQPATLRGLPDVDAVVYAASAGGFTDEGYRRAYVDGVRNLLDALGPVARFAFVSSTGVYGQSEGEWVDETSPTEPAGFSGRLLLEGERLVRARHPGAVVVRFGGIYGPDRDRLVREVRDGEAVVPRASVWTNRIHRDDCAGVLHHVLTLEDPAPVYLGVDSEPTDKGVVLRWLAMEMGEPEPPVADVASSPQRGNKRCRNARLLASGYRFRYPTFREGFRQVLGQRT